MFTFYIVKTFALDQIPFGKCDPQRIEAQRRANERYSTCRSFNKTTILQGLKVQQDKVRKPFAEERKNAL
mgnify:CR=1 FL=1